MAKLLDFSHILKKPKANSQRTLTKDLKPICYIHYELNYTTICARFCYLFQETAEKNLQQIPDPEKDVIWNLLNTSQIVTDSVNIRFLQLPSGFWMLSCKAYFEFAGCSLELKNQGTTQNTEKLSGFPSDQER